MRFFSCIEKTDLKLICRHLVRSMRTFNITGAVYEENVEILAELNLSILINAVELPSRLHILSDLNDEYDLTTNNLYNSTSHVLRTKSVRTICSRLVFCNMMSGLIKRELSLIA